MFLAFLFNLWFWSLPVNYRPRAPRGNQSRVRYSKSMSWKSFSTFSSWFLCRFVTRGKYFHSINCNNGNSVQSFIKYSKEKSLWVFVAKLWWTWMFAPWLTSNVQLSCCARNQPELINFAVPIEQCTQFPHIITIKLHSCIFSLEFQIMSKMTSL